MNNRSFRIEGNFMLNNKTVLLGVSGSIAAYKAASLASLLVKQHANVKTILTPNATQFIAPLTFEELTGNPAYVDAFARNTGLHVPHIALAAEADIAMVAPASADLIARLAQGRADDMLTTTLLACTCPKLLAPAMNCHMYANPAVQENLDTLRRRGWIVIEPAAGRLACGDVGLGKLPEPELLLQYILRQIAVPHDLDGIRVLVTAGPTQEAIDPVRYITNHSTGKMGYSVAGQCMLRGADVTLITGQVSITPPPFVNVVPITSAQDLFEAVRDRADQADLIFKAAAVADYTPTDVADEKIKKKDGDLSIPLKRTQDVLKYLGEHRRPGQVLCGFSMETQNMVENSRAKLEKKNIDIVAANNLKVEGAGFGTNTNVMTLITHDQVLELPLLSKEDTADRIIDLAMEIRNKQL
jgi:phosphopantothenoylcysteine decarboxylase/phosphopantothenate--cysteine ligase